MSQTELVLKEKAKLESERDQIATELENLRELMQAEVDVEPDEGDAEIFEREKNAALIAVLERKVQDIESALRSIDKGHYGVCERCGKPIEAERLEVKPDATLCLSCHQEVYRWARRTRPTRPIEC